MLNFFFHVPARGETKNTKIQTKKYMTVKPAEHGNVPGLDALIDYSRDLFQFFLLLFLFVSYLLYILFFFKLKLCSKGLRE